MNWLRYYGLSSETRWRIAELWSEALREGRRLRRRLVERDR